MKINHECPLQLLQLSEVWNDYEFCLPHLLDESEEYKNYFLEAKKNGRYIIMDNSLHELGEYYNIERLLYWINKLKPDEFIVPDKWEDKDETLLLAEHWKLHPHIGKETLLVPVVHGKTKKELEECYIGLKELGYKKIAFSYGDIGYKNEMYSSKHIQFPSGRIYLINQMKKKGIIKENDRIHLLGSYGAWEFSYYKDIPQIETIDTSNPVMLALDGKTYPKEIIVEKPKSNINNSFYKEIDDKTINLILENTKTLREYIFEEI